jgi:heme exporter protein A
VSAAGPRTALATDAAPAAVMLEAHDLAHRYAGGRGLKRIDFVVRAPGAIAITGVNGSGKSTLLRIVAGLLRPSGGTLAFAHRGRALAPLARRGVIGFASPELAFYPEFTCAENLRFAASAHGLADPDGAVAAALGALGLASRRHDRVGALSSGMQQRLRLAFAVLHRPPVLLLDEPGAHLDDDGRRTMEAFVAAHVRAGGLALIATNEEREWRLADERIELAGRGLGDPA